MFIPAQHPRFQRFGNPHFAPCHLLAFQCTAQIPGCDGFPNNFDKHLLNKDFRWLKAGPAVMGDSGFPN